LLLLQINRNRDDLRLTDEHVQMIRKCRLSDNRNPYIVPLQEGCLKRVPSTAVFRVYGNRSFYCPVSFAMSARTTPMIAIPPPDVCSSLHDDRANRGGF
jgi:hypothetical protein